MKFVLIERDPHDRPIVACNRVRRPGPAEPADRIAAFADE
jgi:hypothetical protein